MFRALLLTAPAAFATANSFDDWKALHSKSYNSASAENNARAAFESNAAIVDKLNSKDDGVVYSNDGPYADLSPEDFESKVLMPPRQVPAAMERERETNAPAMNSPLPTSYDWSDKGPVGPIRDQGTLGTCWAFSTVQNIEGQHQIKTGKYVELSVEQLNECDSMSDITCNDQTQQKDFGCADCGEFGGWPYLAYQYVQKAGGLFTEAEFPYFDESFYPCMATGYSKKMCGNHDDMYCNASETKGQSVGGFCSRKSGFAASITGWKSLSTDETELASQLVQYGPLSVLLNAGSIGGLSSYKKGVWKGGLFGCGVDPKEGILGLDHAVLLVGYGTDGGKDYWKVKNSWGEKWGESGFFRIERGTGRCGINLAASTALMGSSDVVV